MMPAIWNWRCGGHRALLTGKGRGAYLQEELCQAAIERQFEIAGEALAQIRQLDVQLFERDAGVSSNREQLMDTKPPRVDQAFLQHQRQRLTKLREQLLRSIQGERGEDAGLNSQSVGQAQELEEDAQKLAMLENDANLVDRHRRRIRDIERALQKIEDGTYGLSDASGEPIPRKRLEAVPEAIYNVSELGAD